MRGIIGLITMAMVALLLRSTALSTLAAKGLVLDVLAFATVIWAFRAGETWGASFGFVIGLAADLDAAHWLGRHALLLSLMGYAVGRLSRTLVRDSARTQFVIILLATLVHQLWSAAFEFSGLSGWPYLALRVVVASVATAAAGTVLLGIVRRVLGQPLFGHAVLKSNTSS
jgi:rod shape-determining protein MreD